MKHVTYSDKSLLIGDEAADLLMEYAAEVARAHTADTVNLKAYGSDGNAVVATFLLGQGSPLMAETANGDIPEPDNSAAIGYMRDRLRLLTSPPAASAVGPAEFDPDDFDSFETTTGER